MIKIFFCLLSGVTAAQLISFFHVFQSNAQLAETINVLNKTSYILNQAGYMAVPAGRALTSLKEIFPAFAGALFLSLTAGVAISTAAIFSMVICIRFIKFFSISYHIEPTLPYFSLWSLINLLLYVSGENIFTLAYTLIIPLVISSFFNLFSKNKNISVKSNNNAESKSRHKILILVLIISISTTCIFYYFNCDRSVFLRARDYLLLSTKQGEILNDFYYRYNLYAVEAIKSTSYKQIRLFCLVGLTVILPIILYSGIFLSIFCLINHFIINYNLFYFITVMNIRSYISATVAGVITVLISLFILYIFYPVSLMNDPIYTQKMLEHSDYRLRTEGLRKLCNKKNGTAGNRESIWNYQQSIQNAMSGSTVEKYWLANAFGAAKRREALPYIEKLLEDRSINVQCAAIEAMTAVIRIESDFEESGRVAVDKTRLLQNRIIELLKRKITHSDEWYVQKRAYTALKKLKACN